MKIGGDRRGNGWFFLADPLLSWERHSIAEECEELTGRNSRSAFLILGGLLGWKFNEGNFYARFLWFRF